MTVGVFFAIAFRTMGWVTLGLIGGRIAAHRGYPPLLGMAVGIILGPLGLVASLLIPRRRDVVQKELAEELIQHSTHECPTCGAVIAATRNECPRCVYRRLFP
jgi:hypothetical protein